ncbi:Unconventional myosin-Va, variant 2, partial [Dermatophagoides farinae]
KSTTTTTVATTTTWIHVCELCFDNHHNHNNIVDDGKKWMIRMFLYLCMGHCFRNGTSLYHYIIIMVATATTTCGVSSNSFHCIEPSNVQTFNSIRTLNSTTTTTKNIAIGGVKQFID